MAYEKQNFEDGLTLFAEQLNHMEDGIAKNANDIAAKVGISSILKGVSTSLDGTSKNSYTIALSDGSTYTIRDGNNGKNGADGTGVYVFDPNVGGLGDESGYYNSNEAIGTSARVGDVLIANNGGVYKITEIGPYGTTFLPTFCFSLGGSGSSARVGVVELPASGWVASENSENLYSQEVTIAGVTANSQVDLTPDVEQLVVFYEKDLTFVTENENGIVTVYAIGQKPENDYTVQVTITEVSA